MQLKESQRNRAQSFVLLSYTVHAVTYPKRFYKLVSRSLVNNYCVFYTVKAKKENKNIQRKALSSFV